MPKKVKFLGLLEDSVLKLGEAVCDCDCYDCNTDNDHSAESDPD